MKISSKHEVKDVPSDLTVNSGNWDLAIEIVKDRFYSRYFNPIEKLLNSTDKTISNNCGFIIMSTDCLLIETINQFYMGIASTEELYSKNNWMAFRDFFCHTTNLSEFKSNRNLVKIFYSQIRCGLLHQAETKSLSLINIKEKSIVKAIADKADYSDGIIINRNLFHKALKGDFDKYIENLADPNSVNFYGENLREMFIKKTNKLWR
jgi:hypothetical protein